MSDVQFTEEQGFGVKPKTAARAGGIRQLCIDAGIPAGSVDAVLIGAVVVLLCMAGYFFISGSKSGVVSSPKPSAEELQRMSQPH